MPITVFDAVGKFSADTSDLDQFIVKLEQGLSSASEKAAASTQALKEAQDEFRDAIRAISAESGDTTENLTRLAEAEKNLTLAAAAAKQEHSALKRQLLDTGDAGGDAGKKMDYSFREARGSIALTGAELGVHLPRELSMLLAHIPAVGAAFSMMLPIIGVVAAIKLIGDLVEKHENLAKAQQRAALGTENLAIKEADQTRSMELANLKLDDQIAKLEGRPDRNKLKEALIEAGIAADGLATKFAADFEKIDEDLDATTGWLGRFTQDMYSLKSLLLATPETFSEAWHKATKGGEDVAAALSQVHAQLVAINLLRAKPPGNTEEEQVKQQEALAAAYEEMGKRARAALEVVQKQAPENTKAIEQLSSLVASSTAAQVDAGKTIENVHKRVKEAAIEGAVAAATALEKAAKQTLDYQVDRINEFKRAAEVAYNSGKADAASWAVAQVQATDAAAIAHETYLRRLVAIYKQAGEVQKAADAQKNLDEWLEKNVDSLGHVSEAAAKASAEMKKHEERVRKVREEYSHLLDADIAKDFEKTAKAAEALTKADEELLKAQTKLAEDKLSQHYKDQEAAITKLAQMHLITESQKDDRLKLLEQQQANEAIAILNSQLDKEKAAMEAAQAKVMQAQLAHVQSTPFFTDAQLATVKRNLGEAVFAFNRADAAVKAAQAKVDEANANPLSVTPAQLAELKAHLSEAVASYDKALSDLRAAKASAGKATDGLILTAAQVAENKKNLDAATAAYAKAEADVQALHKTATSGQFFTEAEKEQLLKRIAEAEAAFKAAQAVLDAAQKKSSNDNAFIPNAEVLEAEANAKKLAAVVTNTEAQIVQTKEKFNKQSEANDKSHYGRALLLAIANGKELLAEQLKQNHAALLAEENELKLAKARGADTTAINQKITALKQNQTQLEKEATTGKIVTAQLQQNTQAALLAAQAQLALAKANGQNTTAIEKEIADLQKLLNLMKQLPVQGQHDINTLHGLSKAFQENASEAKQMEQSLGTGIADMMEQVMTGQETLGEATKKMVSQLAEQWGKFYIAKGIADMFTDPAAGGVELAEGTALLALGAALGGGGGGGGGKASMQGPSVGQTTASTGGGGGSNQTTGVTHLAAGGITTGPTKAEIGEAGEEAIIPLTDPEAMARFSRAFTLLSPSTMSAASSAMAPHSTVAASTVAPQIFDEAAMERIAGRNNGFGRDESPAAQGGGDTHVHVNIKGSVDHGTIAGLVKKINQGVGNRRLTLNASNSLRVTRRSQ